MARKVQTRERGYTTPGATKILIVSKDYQPAETSNPSNRESAHITAAKRWVPILCAFTGARITEITQLRKEDLREENARWIIRITPDAGSVKTGQFRDVPLHRQVIELGFIDFVQSAEAGPLFHRAKSADKYLANARVTSGRLRAGRRRSKVATVVFATAASVFALSCPRSVSRSSSCISSCSISRAWRSALWPNCSRRSLAIWSCRCRIIASEAETTARACVSSSSAAAARASAASQGQHAEQRSPRRSPTCRRPTTGTQNSPIKQRLLRYQPAEAGRCVQRGLRQSIPSRR